VQFKHYYFIMTLVRCCHFFSITTRDCCARQKKL